MPVICTKISPLKDPSAMELLEAKYGFLLPDALKDFLRENNGGVPNNLYFEAAGTEFELRCFLSLNEGEGNSIEPPLRFFQEESHGKIVPFAEDSGDNYYCIHTENQHIYYWSTDSNLYYLLTDSFDDFLHLLS